MVVIDLLSSNAHAAALGRSIVMQRAEVSSRARFLPATYSPTLYCISVEQQYLVHRRYTPTMRQRHLPNEKA